MKIGSFFTKLFFVSLSLIAFSACVPKATEKKALCGENEAFNNVSKECYQVIEPPQRPVGTLNQISLGLETSQRVTLQYTDKNNDFAESCRVTPNLAGIIIDTISPVAVNGTLSLQVTLLSSAMSSLASYLTVPLSATTYALEVSEILHILTTSYNVEDLKVNLDYLKQKAVQVRSVAAANLDLNIFGSHYELVQTRLNTLEPVLTQLNNNCACSGGVCETYVVTRPNQSGTTDFEYTVTDKDGESSPKQVAVQVLHNQLPHLRPVAGSADGGVFNLSESPNSTAPEYNITLPFPVNYIGNLNGFTSYTYQYVGTRDVNNYGVTTNGRVFGCLGLRTSQGSSTIANGLNCRYLPNNGDLNNGASVATRASHTYAFGGNSLLVRARNTGLYGNQLSIRFFDIKSDLSSIDSHLTKAQKMGMAGGSITSEAFIRVIGDEIQAFINPGITTLYEVSAMINAHELANKLVTTITGGSDTPNTGFLVTASAQNLIGGTNAFDSFNYKVLSANGESTNTGSVHLSMTAVNDPPLVPSEESALYTAVATIDEDSSSNPFTVHFRDVDSDAPLGFTFVPSKIGRYNIVTDECDVEAGIISLHSVSFNTCAAGAMCAINLSIDAHNDFNGDACFTYRVTDNHLPSATSVGEQFVLVKVLPINDAPIIANVGPASPLTPLALPVTIPAIDEDLVSGQSYLNLYLSAGGRGNYENGQGLNFLIGNTNTTLFNSRSCANYEPHPNPHSLTDVETGAIYLDTTYFHCLEKVASGWKYYSSVTMIPDCDYTNYGAGLPSTGTSGIAGSRYLDTQNNKCYTKQINGQWTEGAYTQDTPASAGVHHYKLVFIPEADKSGSVTFTLTATDTGTPALNTTATFNLTVNSFDDLPVFTEAPALVKTNEGGFVVAGPFRVDEDLGATSDEDAQGMTVVSVISDNSSVLPNSNISIFYDLNDNGVEDIGEARAVGQRLEVNRTDDAAAYPVFLKLRPVEGEHGNANIVVTIVDRDNGVAPLDPHLPAYPAVARQVSRTFSLVVNPVSAIHGGWENLASVGIKTNKAGLPVEVLVNGALNTTEESDIKCNYNRSEDAANCSGVDCRGVGSPHAVVVANSSNLMFWDYSNQSCYRSVSSGASSWVEVKTSCPVSRKLDGTNDFVSAAPTGSLTPTYKNQYVYDVSDNTCYVSTGLTNADWEEYVPAKVTLSWKPFGITGLGPYSNVGIAGWNVYRREVGTDFDFSPTGHLKNGNGATMTIDGRTVNMTIAGQTTRTFTDATAIAGKVYYYMVLPVDSREGHPTKTTEVFSEIRVLAPPANYSFVHRWMINQEICSGLYPNAAVQPTAIDPANNFRCQYRGPGSTEISGIHYYDYGQDLLVDMQEAGCAYAPAPKCGSNGCVGIGNPSVLAGLDDGDLYYNRANGTCHSYESGTWEEMSGADPVLMAQESLNSALNPPLTNISKGEAASLCSSRAVPTLNGLTNQPATAKLPNKKDFMAYSAHRLDWNSTEVSIYEMGQSLNNASACNGMNAGGLDAQFIDSAVPSGALSYTIAGTKSSGIRSLHTGSIPWGFSQSTRACISRYGIQDVYGNVSEWIDEHFTCRLDTAAGPPLEEMRFCTAQHTGQHAGSSFKADDFTIGLGTDFPYLFSSPVSETTGGVTTLVETAASGLTIPLASTTSLNVPYEQGETQIGYFNYPLGLPIHSKFEQIVDDAFKPWLLYIGSSQGILTSRLHDDGLIADLSVPAVNTNVLKNVSVGGSYLPTSRSGRFTMEMTNSTATNANTGFRCVIPIAEGDY